MRGKFRLAAQRKLERCCGMPAFPLKLKHPFLAGVDISAYLKWATDSFLLSTAIAQPKTSIHTHMCYCDFGDCMEAIDRLDADVNSIENGALPQARRVEGETSPGYAASRMQIHLWRLLESTVPRGLNSVLIAPNTS